MNDELIERLANEIQKRQNLPKALLIGRTPTENTGFCYVTQGEYSAVVIGSMSAYELLTFPNETVVEALLSGKPVYLAQNALDYRAYSRSANRALWSRLLSAERQMKQLGVQTLGTGKLLTAQEVRRRLREGQPIEGRLTPLARDVLEGKA